MTGSEFKIMIIEARLSQRWVAKTLEVDPRTINRLCRADHVPKVYEIALKAVIHSLNNPS